MERTAAFRALAERLAGGSETAQRPPRRCAFEAEARDVASRLVQVRGEIMQFVEQYSSALGAGLSEEQRDMMDAHVAAELQKEQARLSSLGEAVAVAGVGQQQVEHRRLVLGLVHEQLQLCTRMTSELQLLRMRQTVSAKKALRVEGSAAEVAELEALAEEERHRQEDGLRRRRGAAQERKAQRQAMPQDGESSDNVVDADDADDADDDDDDDEPWDPQQEQAFEAEQAALSAQLVQEEQRVRAAEKQMREFSDMATVFHSKLEEQSRELENVVDAVRESTSYVTKSRGEIMSAKAYNTSFRKYVIIFFGVASGLLLLLDRMD